jgi:sulfoxide reductase heme-binding subunit YedZ
MSEVWWYAARSAGLVAYVLLTGSVVFGLAISTRAMGRRARPAWLLDLHRWLGGLATIFVGVHLLALIADSYTQFDLIDVLVPFASSWHPTAVAWGVVAFWLLVAVELTSLARRRLPRRLWRVVHTVSFPLFVLSTLHFLFAGTDAWLPVMQMGVVAAVGLVAVLTFVRLWQLDAEPEPVDATPRAPDDRVLAGRR